MEKAIPQISFKNSPKVSFDFEIFPVRQLFQGHLTGAITDHSIIAPHRLSFHMILLVTKGKGQHYIDFQSYPYEKGSILFLTKGQIHAWEVKAENDGLLIVFSEAFLQKSFGFSSVLQYYRLFNYQLYTPIHQLEASQFGEFMDLFSKLEREYNEPNDFAKEKIIGSLMSYLLLKAERLTRQKKLPVENEHYQKLFIDFKNLLFTNYKNDRNAAYYADSLSVSYKHLNKVCKATINQTAKTFITNFLILEIKRILISSNISVKELTYQMGFDEPTNLVKFFKKYSHQTPAQFRKAYQK